MAKHLGGVILLTFKVEPADGQYAAQCPELGTVTCGATVEEAMGNLQEAVTVHLNALEDVKTRERVFRERGIALLPTSEPARGSDVVSMTRSVRQPVYA